MKLAFGTNMTNAILEATNIAGGFADAWEIINNMGDYDLANGGSDAFMADMKEALLSGKADLEEYAPLIREAVKQAEEFDKMIEEALALPEVQQFFLDLEKRIEELTNFIETDLANALRIGFESDNAEEGWKNFTESFKQSLEQAVMEAIVQGMLNAVIFAGSIAGDIAQLEVIVSAAMEDGVITEEEKAEIVALGQKIVSDGVAKAAMLKPIFDELFGEADVLPELQQFFVDLEKRIGELTSSIKSELSSALRIGFQSEDAEKGWKNFNESFKQSLEQAVMEAIIQGMLNAVVFAGSIAADIAQLEVLVNAAMADGVITEEEKAEIVALGQKIVSDGVAKAAILKPIFDELFGPGSTEEDINSWMKEVAKNIEEHGAQLAGSLGDVMRQALIEDLTYEEFAENAKNALYEHVRDGLINAFIDSVIIQGALAPALKMWEAVFMQIAAGQMKTAEDWANAQAIIIEGFALVNGLFNDPQFIAMFELWQQQLRDLANTIGYTGNAMVDASSRISDASSQITDQAKQVAQMGHDLIAQTFTLGQLMLDIGGGSGSAEVTLYVPQRTVEAQAQAAFDRYWQEYREDYDSSGAFDRPRRGDALRQFLAEHPEYASVLDPTGMYSGSGASTSPGGWTTFSSSNSGGSDIERLAIAIENQPVNVTVTYDKNGFILAQGDAERVTWKARKSNG